jgi:hypothetical protein
MTANLQAPNKHGCRSAAKIPIPKPNWTHDGEIIQKHTQMVRRLTFLLQSRTKFDNCDAWAKPHGKYWIEGNTILKKSKI